MPKGPDTPCKNCPLKGCGLEPASKACFKTLNGFNAGAVERLHTRPVNYPGPYDASELSHVAEEPKTRRIARVEQLVAATNTILKALGERSNHSS